MTTELRASNPHRLGKLLVLKRGRVLEDLGDADRLNSPLRDFADQLRKRGSHPCGGCGGRTKKIEQLIVYSGRVIVAYEGCEHIRDYVPRGSNVPNDIAFVKITGGFRIRYGTRQKEKIPSYMRQDYSNS